MADYTNGRTEVSVEHDKNYWRRGWGSNRTTAEKVIIAAALVFFVVCWVME